MLYTKEKELEIKEFFEALGIERAQQVAIVKAENSFHPGIHDNPDLVGERVQEGVLFDTKDLGTPSFKLLENTEMMATGFDSLEARDCSYVCVSNVSEDMLKQMSNDGIATTAVIAISENAYQAVIKTTKAETKEDKDKLMSLQLNLEKKYSAGYDLIPYLAAPGMPFDYYNNEKSSIVSLNQSTPAQGLNRLLEKSSLQPGQTLNSWPEGLELADFTPDSLKTPERLVDDYRRLKLSQLQTKFEKLKNQTKNVEAKVENLVQAQRNSEKAQEQPKPEQNATELKPEQSKEQPKEQPKEEPKPEPLTKEDSKPEQTAQEQPAQEKAQEQPTLEQPTPQEQPKPEHPQQQKSSDAVEKAIAAQTPDIVASVLAAVKAIINAVVKTITLGICQPFPNAMAQAQAKAVEQPAQVKTQAKPEKTVDTKEIADLSKIPMAPALAPGIENAPFATPMNPQTLAAQIAREIQEKARTQEKAQQGQQKNKSRSKDRSRSGHSH